MTLFHNLDGVLKGPNFRRDDAKAVDRAIDRLVTTQCEILREFYRRYRGPLGSEVIGYQLLDIILDTPSIATATGAIRKQFNLDQKWLVISDLLANSALLYDTEEDLVYDVDFEGGIELLICGNLQPRWKSFQRFLEEFFNV